MEEVELNDNDDREGRGCEQLQQQAGFGVLTQTEVVEPRRREICEQFTVGRVHSVKGELYPKNDLFLNKS